jgi:putative transposase
MKKYKAYKFKIEPTNDQKILLDKHFGCSRYIYNTLLREKQEHYLENGKTLNYNKCASLIVNWKKKEETKWLKEVNSQSLQQAAKNLETSYGNFFRTKKGFPKFKKKDGKNSFNIPQHIKLEKNKIFIPKFKDGIKIKLHRQIKGNIKSATFSKTSTGKYFVSILSEEKIKAKPKTNKEIGLDLGIKDFAILSNGKKYSNPKYLNKYQDKLKKAQKDLSRKKKGSNRYNNQKLKIAKIYEKIANSRLDFQHKLSTKLIEKYDFISIESLKVKNMIKNHNLAKAISDCSWSQFVSMLEYKCDWYRKTLVKIDQWYPSSKTCSDCNYIYQGLKLNDRRWTCPKCNTHHDRDINASKNIYRAGRSITDMEKKALVRSLRSNETSFDEVSKIPIT